ncbi:uncharacterized protein [Henckelia pumila]|uniref:uncharacterized protein n=1 Tax=Henckelia pumila TaxID=405737 RepID=UPI003C6E6C6E
MDYGLHYSTYPSVLEGYCDANWISDTKDSKSTSGYVFTIGGGAVSWKSSKQTCIARSTMESEFIALDKAGEEAEWLRNFLEDIPCWMKPVPAIMIHCDSQAAIGRAQSSMYNGVPSTSLGAKTITTDIKNPSFDQMKKKFDWFQIISFVVPGLKNMRDKKVMHRQAHELVKCLCDALESLSSSDAASIYGIAIFDAAHNGIHEVVELIIEIFPNAIYKCERETQRTIFHVAARERKWKSSLNHLAGHDEDKTPYMLFTEKHRELKLEGEKWMKDTATSCTIAAALIATVVFTAVFTVPGGVSSDYGVPMFVNQISFIIFSISNSVSMFTATTSLLMFLSILTSRYAEQDFFATVYITLRSKSSLFLIPVAAFACLPVASFVLLQFPLLITVLYSTYGPGIFGKKKQETS